MAEKTELAADYIARFASVPSVKGEPEPGAPYGRQCRRMLDEAEAALRAAGLTVETDPEGRWTAGYLGEGELTVGLFAHGDVVPPGDDWTLTDPFSPRRMGDFMIGRGVNDDKSGLALSLLAARAIVELGLPLKGRLMIYVGADEESGMSDLSAFVSSHELPVCGIVPDAGFPAHRGEKGILRFRAISPALGSGELTEMDVGIATNVVPARGRAVFRGEEITVEGVGGHAATPEGTVNAGAKLLAELKKRAGGRTAEILAQALDLIGDGYGSGLGVAADDPTFGRTTAICSMIKPRADGRLSLTFDVRYGTCAACASTAVAAEAAVKNLGWEYEEFDHSPGFLLAEDDALVTAAKELWTELTGNVECSKVSRGGTYARLLPHAISIGASFPHSWPDFLPKGHGLVHGPDEITCVSGVCEAAAFAAMLACRVSGMAVPPHTRHYPMTRARAITKVPKK